MNIFKLKQISLTLGEIRCRCDDKNGTKKQEF